ncbi:hypothetical protein [Aeromonas veronii]|uniref:hypothetical protein n=1 Tax=Aeromonas veronii TaxID=654 RepID=UPI001247A7E5|nr:hypothetical protein [Aeromonas veronii]KAB0673323.1 hypothetical protein F3X86_06670 [Aeromonas veronii]
MKIEQTAPLAAIATPTRPQGSPIGRFVSQFRNLTAPAAEPAELTLPTPPALTPDSQQLLNRELRKGISSYLAQHPEQQTALDELLSAGQMRNELGKPTLATSNPMIHLVTLLNQLKKLPDGKALTKTLVKDPAGEIGRYITLKGSFGSKSCQLRGQPLPPRSLSEPDLLQLALELKQVLQHYLDADPAKSERHTAYLRDYLQQPEIGRYLGLLDTPNGAQVKINALPSRKEEIANLMNRLLAGHGRGSLYHAFAQESGREGILGRHFKLEGVLEFSFAVRAEPHPPTAVPPLSPAPSDDVPDPALELQKAAQQRQQEALEHLKLEQEITRQLANRPACQALAKLTRAAANLQAELDGQHLPPAVPIPTTRVDLTILARLSLPQVRELAQQLKEENNHNLQQVEANTLNLPTHSDADRFSPHTLDMLGITLTQPYVKVLDDGIQALRQPATSRTARLLGWLLPAQAKAHQLKQEQSIGKLHELRQVITMLQLQGGSWQGVEQSGWAKQLLARTLEQAMPTPWQLGPFRIKAGLHQWQTRLNDWGIPTAKG